METCAPRVLNAVRRPNASLGLKGDVVHRVPISCKEDRGTNSSKELDIAVKYGHNLVSFRYR
jgi:hypothetical protein